VIEGLKSSGDKRIGFIPTAVGGTAIEHWCPDGILFKNMLEQTSIGMRLAEADGLNPRLAGLLFYQGESDATSEALASAYESKLEVSKVPSSPLPAPTDPGRAVLHPGSPQPPWRHASHRPLRHWRRRPPRPLPAGRAPGPAGCAGELPGRRVRRRLRPRVPGRRPPPHGSGPARPRCAARERVAQRRAGAGVRSDASQARK
jgi:hypothetical protein